MSSESSSLTMSTNFKRRRACTEATCGKIGRWKGLVFGGWILGISMVDYTGWWLNQPISKIWVKLDHVSRDRGENKKYWKPPPDYKLREVPTKNHPFSRQTWGANRYIPFWWANLASQTVQVLTCLVCGQELGALFGWIFVVLPYPALEISSHQVGYRRGILNFHL